MFLSVDSVLTVFVFFLYFYFFIFFFFFFQAEDGIRDHCVTGVQTCALPISPPGPSPTKDITKTTPTRPFLPSPMANVCMRGSARAACTATTSTANRCGKIRRASCRERV